VSVAKWANGRLNTETLYDTQDLALLLRLVI
jgi:hypothetical protein